MIKATESPPLRAVDATQCLPHKTFECEFKAIDDAGNFSIYAAIFGNIDKGGDVIEAGAFDNLPEFIRDGFIAIGHDTRGLPVAYPTAATQDSKGLLVSGTFHSTPEAQACRVVARERMAAGKGVKASIGYVTNDEAFERIDGRQIRRIKKLSIWEASFVSLPMNPQAEATSIKSHSQGDTMPEPPVETKRSVAISAANHSMLKAFGDRLDEHAKGLKECHKAMTKTHGEMKAFIGGFAPAAADDGDDGDDEEEVEVVEKPRKKPEKVPEPEPKALTQEQQTLATYHDQLRRRSNAGRKVQSCP